MTVMAGEEQNDVLEARRLIATVPLIPEVEKIDVELYTDNTGDPALELLFRVKTGVEVDRAFIRRFNEFAGRVQTVILHSQITRFPYARLRQAA